MSNRTKDNPKEQGAAIRLLPEQGKITLPEPGERSATNTAQKQFITTSKNELKVTEMSQENIIGSLENMPISITSLNMSAKQNVRLDKEPHLQPKLPDAGAELEEESIEKSEKFSIHHNKTDKNFTNNSSTAISKKATKDLMVPLKVATDYIKKIENAKENDIITLPGSLIQIPALHITSSIMIKGSPGTILEITAGPIVIDIITSSSTEPRVSFCECTINFNPSNRKDSSVHHFGASPLLRDPMKKTIEYPAEIRTAQDDNRSYHISEFTSKLDHSLQLPLFLVKSNAILEVRDCQIRSIKEKNLSISESKLPSEIQDICFLVQGSSESSKRHAALRLKSCTLTNFHTFIRSDSFNSLHVQKSYFSVCRGHAIALADPRSVTISDCVFDRAAKSAINMKFSREIYEGLTRRIKIGDNQILNSEGYAISLFSENLNYHDLAILIFKNIIMNSQKEAVALKFLNISELQIYQNEIQSTSRNGIYIHNVINSMSNQQCIIQENKITKSGIGGIVIKDSSCLLESNEISENTQYGVYFSSSDTVTPEEEQFYQKNPVKLFVNKCRIAKNAGTGINVSGMLKGPIILSSSAVNENLNGIIINEIENPNKRASMMEETKKSESTKTAQKDVGRRVESILFEKSEISRNSANGILVHRLCNDLFINQSVIVGNQLNAIWIVNASETHLLKLMDAQSGKLKEHVQGNIGGPWGKLSEEKLKMEDSKNSNCVIF